MDLFAAIDKVKEEFGENDAKALSELLKNQTLLKVLREMLRLADGAATKMLSVDLTTEEGRLEAISLQQLYKGMLRTLDLFNEMRDIDQVKETENG